MAPKDSRATSYRTRTRDRDEKSTNNQLLQLANQYAAELDGVAVMLQRNSAASGDAGELHVVDHQFAVEQYSRSVSLHRDVEARSIGRLVCRSAAWTLRDWSSWLFCRPVE